MSRSPSRRGAPRLGVLLAVLGLIVAAYAAAGQATTSAPGRYTLGISNTLVGNGWREGMICSIKAQALKSGQVSSLRIAHRQTDTAGQIADIRTMISAGVDAIIINPSNANALKPIANQARAGGLWSSSSTSTSTPAASITRPTTRSPTGVSVRSGSSRSSVAAATWSRCVGSPACRPTQIGTRASCRLSGSTRTSRS